MLAVSDPLSAPSCQAGRQEYLLRQSQRQDWVAQLARTETILGTSRVIVFLLGCVLAWLALWSGLLSILWLIVPGLAFVALLFWHDRVRFALSRARRAVRFYERGLARLEHRWQGGGQPGTRFLDENHLYAQDLDLFGSGSLFELLCTARTRIGEDTLASWLKAPATPDEVRQRQAAVAELKPMLDLREELAMLGSDLPAGVDFQVVASWGGAPPVLVPRWPRWIALVLGVLSVITAIGWVLAFFQVVDPTTTWGGFFDRVGSIPFIIVLCVQLTFYAFVHRRVHEVLSRVARRGRDLALLSHVLRCLEDAHFTSPALTSLQEQLAPSPHPASSSSGNVVAGGKGIPPSQQIAQLGNLLEILDSRRNQLFAPVALLLMWGTQCAYAIESWRNRSGPHIARWLAVVGRFEALCSLATYAYENPGDPFPEMVEQGPCYQGEALGHPLLPGCVRNDLSLSDDLRVLIVSGSNMSGKSTFLRTVGINAVLALAGAPVRARQLKLSPLAVGATLRIQDSLQAGRSRFYAEVLRLRQLVEKTQDAIPLLFLLDEIFAGTNSHDRRIGAEALVQGLVRAGAIGLVTTHDLTLTHIADQLTSSGAGATNVHFADHFENGEMRFDYQLHQGVVQKSNALALMRSVGLEV